MHTQNFLSGALLALSGLAAAAPTGSAAPAPTSFQLKTVVVAGDSKMNNLYLEGYHTGAGTADAVLSQDRPTNQAITMNGTSIQFTYGSSTPFAYLNPRYDTNYAVWDDMYINFIDGPTPGFYFNNSAANVDGLGIGLKWNPNYPYAAPADNKTGEFGGWLACDWYHQTPQLFWIIRDPNNAFKLIDTCSKVELVRA